MELAGDDDLAGECIADACVVRAGVALVAVGTPDVLDVPAVDAGDPPA
jgi:hypothetical protein